MAEVRRRAVRPSSSDPRRTTIAALGLAALVLGLSACGSADDRPGDRAEGRSAAAHPTTEATKGADVVQGCPADSRAIAEAGTLTRADLDGDGIAEDVRLTGPGTDCPAVLFARIGSGHVSAQLPLDAPPVTSGRAVRVPGVKADLVATRQDHPRGGYQIRVWAVGAESGSDDSDGELAELRGQAGSVLPFIATDSLSTPVALACADAALVVTEATADEPTGGAFAWTVSRTTYAVQAGALAPAEVTVLAEQVSPRRLERRFPALVGHRLFTGCD